MPLLRLPERAVAGDLLTDLPDDGAPTAADPTGKLSLEPPIALPYCVPEFTPPLVLLRPTFIPFVFVTPRVAPKVLTERRIPPLCPGL
jgi:hypothetical protein